MSQAPERGRIVLASASPRRRELLAQIGVQFTVQPADIDEIAIPGEAPADFVQRMAREKAQAVADRRGTERHRCVLGADTAVVVDEDILGKPQSVDEARAMLRGLSGRTHQVYSAVAVVSTKGEVMEALNITAVTFDELDENWISAYCETGDPMDKAGAYGVQGWAGEKISRIEGSFYGVMGLPLFETAQLLTRAKVIL